MVTSVGDTGVIIAMADAQDVVGFLRNDHDSSAQYGVPAHVTLLFPFVELADLTTTDVSDLAAICGAEPAFDVVFARVRRWPSVVWLEPEPDEPFRRLTLAIAERWPHRPPYGGLHDGVTPHLTVIEGADQGVLDAAQRRLPAVLPIADRATEAQLIAFDGQRYRVHATFPLGS